MSTNKDPVHHQPDPGALADEAIPNEHGEYVRPVLEVLSRLRKGQVMDLLSLELNRVVNGVKDCQAGKAGTVTLTLKIEPVKKQQNAVFIQANILGKAPEDPPTSDLLFYDDAGNLHSRNPNQRDIFEDGPLSVPGGRDDRR